MQLKTQQMVELLLALGSPGRTTGGTWQGSERRSEPRAVAGYPTRLRALAGGTGLTADPEAATLLDVTSRGVGLALGRPMEAGESFVIELPRLGGDTFEILCLAANSRPLAGGQFHVGARFLAPWREDDATGADSHSETTTAAA